MAYSVCASGTVYDNLNHLFTNAKGNITIMTPAIGINNRYFLKDQIFPITISDKVFDKDNNIHIIDYVIVELEQEMFETGVYVNIIFSTESTHPSTPEFRRRMPADTDSPPFAPMKHQFTDHTEVNEDVNSVSLGSPTSDTMPGLELVCQLINKYELNKDSDDMDSVDSDSSRDSLSSLEAMFIGSINRLPYTGIKEQKFGGYGN